MVASAPKDAVPPYLRAVTILEPKGDAVAETVAAVRRFSRWPKRRVAMLGAILVVLTMAGYWQWRQRGEGKRQAITALAAAEQLCASGDYALAWQRFEDAVKQHSDRRDLRTAREDCAMVVRGPTRAPRAATSDATKRSNSTRLDFTTH